jgi:hypothetical protein
MHSEGIIKKKKKTWPTSPSSKVSTADNTWTLPALTLLNADIKLLARIIALRISIWLQAIIHQSQHCGIQGTSIIEAVANIRGAISYAEYTRTKLCILTLDFQAAFDKIAHSYLYQALRAHGFSENVVSQIKTLYDGATASVQINGHSSTPIQIHSSARQGCPLSMQLYTICLNPLLHMIDGRLRGIRINPRQPKTTIIA